MIQKRNLDSSFSLTGVEKLINSMVHLIFYYRMIWITVFIGAILTFSLIAWNSSKSERIKNVATILTCGSVIIGITYAILNYEMNYFKYKRDQVNARKQAAFHLTSEWHKDSNVQNLKITKRLYEQHKHLIEEYRSREFSKILDNDEAGRAALISIFNYMECISLGVEHGIHDEIFIRDFFKSVFISYLTEYEFYILYRRKQHKNPNIWIKFTDLATKWRNANV